MESKTRFKSEVSATLITGMESKTRFKSEVSATLISGWSQNAFLAALTCCRQNRLLLSKTKKMQESRPSLFSTTGVALPGTSTRLSRSALG
jgi:hypothetical protein